MSSDHQELLPCLCGEAPFSYPNNVGQFIVYCRECHRDSVGYDYEAVKLDWNTRATPPAPKASGEELKAVEVESKPLPATYEFKLVRRPCPFCQDEIEKLKSAIDSIEKFNAKTFALYVAEIERLEAQVKELVSAGSDIADTYSMYWRNNAFLSRWQAAVSAVAAKEEK